MKDVIVERALTAPDALEALDAALRAALGSKCAGVSAGKGRIVVHLVGEFDAEDENTAVTIVTNHDMSTRTQRQIDEAAAATTSEQARTNVANIPGWATYTEAQALAWIDTNVTDLASAKRALRAMARMLVALRDAQWPNLN